MSNSPSAVPGWQSTHISVPPFFDKQKSITSIHIIIQIIFKDAINYEQSIQGPVYTYYNIHVHMCDASTGTESLQQIKVQGK